MNEDKKKGPYFAHVLRSTGYDSSNNGITFRYEELWLFSDEWTDNEIEQWCEKEGRERERCVRVSRMMSGYVRAEVVFREPGFLYMFGGNFIDGDSRFHDEVNRYPIIVLDRKETQEEYNALSM